MWEPPFYQLEKSLLRIWRGVSEKFEKSGQVARGWVNSRVLHKPPGFKALPMALEPD